MPSLIKTVYYTKMQTVKNFTVGQRVKIYDKEECCNVYGHIIEIREKSIIVKWNDLSEPCEHFETFDDFQEIKSGNPCK